MHHDPVRSVRPPRPPAVRLPADAPAWAGDLGDRLLRRSHNQAGVGYDRPEFQGRDPLEVLTDWFGPGDRATKPALEPSMDRFHPKRVRPFRPSWGVRRIEIDKTLAVRECVTVSWSLDGVTSDTKPYYEFDSDLLEHVMPMRDFDRRLEKENQPVAPWLHTVGHMVGAESHQERAFMVLADFHPAVRYIAGQPFTLTFPEGTGVESHTPDIALLGTNGLPLIVDVKSPVGAVDEKWASKVPVIAKAIHAMGYGYLVWSGMSRAYRLNLEDFSEARVPPASYNFWAPVAVDLCDEPMTASDLADRLDATGYQRTWALTLIRRMLWRRALVTDMFHIYGTESIVEPGDA